MGLTSGHYLQKLIAVLALLLEVAPLLGVELHASGKALYDLALRGPMDFGGVPPVVQFVEEVCGSVSARSMEEGSKRSMSSRASPV